MEKIKQVMREFWPRWLAGFCARWWYLLIACGIIAFDQITKRIAVNTLKGQADVVFIKNFITWSYHENRGSAYGMLADARWVFMTVSVVGIIAFVLFLYGKRTRNTWLDVGLAFVIGGGMGNMIDRSILGYVVDFIGTSIGDFALTNYTCNVADIFVCVGGAIVFVAVVVQVIMEERDKKKAVNRASEQAKKTSEDDPS